mgnify:CR=1 FL=1
MPSLDNLQAEMGDENFQVIIVSVERTAFSKVDNFLKEINIKNLNNYHDTTTMVGKYINAKGLPITILFDRNGKEIGRYDGEFEWDSKEVVKYIAELNYRIIDIDTSQVKFSDTTSITINSGNSKKLRNLVANKTAETILNAIYTIRDIDINKKLITLGQGGKSNKKNAEKNIEK